MPLASHHELQLEVVDVRSGDDHAPASKGKENDFMVVTQDQLPMVVTAMENQCRIYVRRFVAVLRFAIAWGVSKFDVHSSIYLVGS